MSARHAAPRRAGDGGTAGGTGMGGVAVAGVTAVISGVSVFVNSYGVHHVASPSVYTTAKNLVAFVALAAGALAAQAWRRRAGRTGAAAARWVGPPRPDALSTLSSRSALEWLGLAYVGLVGGGVAFVLFFDGLARTTATPAAFLRDTLVIWVAILGVPFLHERVTKWNLAAIALLVGGEVALARGIGHLSFGAGDLLVLGATLLWAVEVVVAKKLLAAVAPATLALVRMGVGSVALVGYLAVTGALGALFSLDRGQLGWVLVTGLLLAGYVGTWLTALSRARAVDVTSILVASALVTALLQGLAGVAPLAPQWLGLALIAAGTVVVAWGVPRRGAGVSEGAARRRPDAPAAPGPVVFARYAYPPNELGYCGPSDPGALLESGAEGADLAELAHLATGFAGAWPYLELIAGCNGIADPLDARVVEAYWVGNALVDRVPASALVSSLGERFERRAGKRFGPVAAAVPLGGVCQHSFHVFAVYPWLGLLKAGMEGAPLTVLDRCRIRWGTVEAVTGDLVTVRNRVLDFDGWRLVLGPERVEVARRSLDGVGLAPAVEVGDTVSLHWDWVCDRLSPPSLAWLRQCTAQNLAAVNALDTPGPAAVVGA